MANIASRKSGVKQQDVASGIIPLTLTSLASDSNLLAGRQSTAIYNTGSYLDFMVSGKVTMGTTPTASKQLDIWLYGSLDEVPTWPDQITGVDGNVTMTTRDILAAGCSLLMTITPTTTSNQVWYLRSTGIAQFFGGVLPTAFGLYVVHNMVAALNATAANHVFKYSPRYAAVG